MIMEKEAFKPILLIASLTEAPRPGTDFIFIFLCHVVQT